MVNGPRVLRKAAAAGLLAAKVAVRLPDIASGWRSDLIWLERDIYPRFRTLEPILGRPFVYDIDDALWLLQPGGARAVEATARAAAAIFAGNEYLADYVSRFSSHVHVVPTVVDTGRFQPKPYAQDGPFTIGWTGSSSNFGYLGEIAPALGRFLKATDSRLLIVAERRPSLPDLPSDKVDFEQWDEAIEVEVLHRMDVGLAPLGSEPWAQGKCGLKVLQYLACAVPVVSSDVGANAAILSGQSAGLVVSGEDEWVRALDYLYANREHASSMGQAGRLLVTRTYSVEAVVDRIASALRAAGR
jgi:glycosyltransferase involved in cell wall biosynthesis